MKIPGWKNGGYYVARYRRWLDTVYESGGFTEEQIAILWTGIKRSNAYMTKQAYKTRMERVQNDTSADDRRAKTDTYHRLAKTSAKKPKSILQPVSHGKSYATSLSFRLGRPLPTSSELF